MFKYLLFLIGIGGGTNLCAQNVATPFRGHVEIDRLFFERIVKPDSQFNFAGRYLGNSNQLFQLLGSYDSNGLSQIFANGTPNVVNVLLYYLALSGFANEIVKACEPPPPPTVPTSMPTTQPSNSPPAKKQVSQPTPPKTIYDILTDDFQSDLHTICEWPNGDSKKAETLQRIWTDVMAYDAPTEEYQAWHDFFLNSEYSTKTSSDVIPAMMLAMFTNPYFLLQQ